MKRRFVRAPAETQLVLIDVDPHRLHAFWTVPRAAMERALQALGKDGNAAALILRVHEEDTHGLGQTQGAAFDVEVGGLQSRSYVDVFGTARRYRAVLGLRAGDDRFVALATSNLVELPPAHSSASNAFRQIDVENPEAGRVIPDPATPPHGAPERFPLPPETLENPWAPRASDPHASTVPAAAPPGPPPLVLEEALTSSSYALGRAGGFDVSVELHVFGHADPDQELTLFGRTIPMRPDGSFSIRRILPNDPAVIEALLDSGDASADRGER